MTNLLVSLSPHIHANDSVEKNMRNVIIALLPVLGVSVAYFGIGAAIVCATSVVACLFFEWVIAHVVMKSKRNTLADGSAVVTGLLLAFNLPSNLPVWMVVVGALVAIGIGKMTFGGLGCNPFNPALVGRCFMLVSFPAQMTSWPVAGQLTCYTDATTEATPLSIMKWAIKTNNPEELEKLPDALHMLLGNPAAGFGAGALGEVSALAIMVGLAYMLWKKVITWHIPVSIIATVAVCAGLLHMVNPAYSHPVSVLLSGGLLLGAVFMATDYATSPMTHKGQVVYGVAIGLLTIVIRNWGAYPEGMSFAILIMNAFTPLINVYMKPKRFGEKIVKKA